MAIGSVNIEKYKVFEKSCKELVIAAKHLDSRLSDNVYYLGVINTISEINESYPAGDKPVAVVKKLYGYYSKLGLVIKDKKAITREAVWFTLKFLAQETHPIVLEELGQIYNPETESRLKELNKKINNILLEVEVGYSLRYKYILTTMIETHNLLTEMNTNLRKEYKPAFPIQSYDDIIATLMKVAIGKSTASNYSATLMSMILKAKKFYEENDDRYTYVCKHVDIMIRMFGILIGNETAINSYIFISQSKDTAVELRRIARNYTKSGIDTSTIKVYINFLNDLDKLYRYNPMIPLPLEGIAGSILQSIDYTIVQERDRRLER